MKSKRLGYLVIIAIVLVAMTGCQSKNNSDNNNNSNKEPKQKEVVEKVVEAKVDIDYYKDDGKVKDYTQVTDERYGDSEYAVSLLINTDQSISDVRLLGVETGNVTDETTKLFVKDEIYKTDKLTPEKPIVLKTVFPNFMTNLAMEYKDTTGETKVLSITMSGEDSSIVVAKAQLEDGKAPVASANVVMEFLTEESRSDYPEYNEFSDPAYNNAKYQKEICVTTDQTVTELKIYDATMGDGEDEVTGYKVNSILYSLDELNPEKPLLFKTEFPGAIPTRVISYKDTNGEEKVFSLSMSGEDGTLVTAPAYIEN